MKIGGTIRKIRSVEMGKQYPPVIFTHIGVGDVLKSDLETAIELEISKMQKAVARGADVICDVSVHENIPYIHKRILEKLDKPFGAVSIYETYINSKKNDYRLPMEEFLLIIKEQIMRGIDIITLHATVFQQDRKIIGKSTRCIPTTSRGGMMMLELLEKNQYENPYYIMFDQILNLCKQYRIGISLGPTYRPASIVDAHADEELYNMELRRMKVLVEKAIKADVGIAIEGIGHAALNHIPSMIEQAKKICGEIPYRVMPVCTDISVGYDHIAGAIAEAVAVQYGADSITCVTRSEHIKIPNIEDVEESVMAAKVAAYSGYISRTKNYDKDLIMSKAKKNKGCLGSEDVALFDDLVKKEKDKHPKGRKACSMCGEYCPLDGLEKNWNI